MKKINKKSRNKEARHVSYLKNREHSKQYALKNKNKIKIVKHQHYLKNRDKIRAYQLRNKDRILRVRSKHDLRNKPKIRMQRVKYYLKNQGDLRAKSAEYYFSNRANRLKSMHKYRLKTIDARRAKRLEKRMLVLRFYSVGNPKCACCAETEVKFLAVDHINGGGGQHRRKIREEGFKSDFYSWLIKNNFPDGFQILCHNCNMAKGFYGACPHKI